MPFVRRAPQAPSKSRATRGPGRPSSRHLQDVTENGKRLKRRLLAAAPEDFSHFAKNTGATFRRLPRPVALTLLFLALKPRRRRSLAPRINCRAAQCGRPGRSDSFLNGAAG